LRTSGIWRWVSRSRRFERKQWFHL
jgi:hypothetical protein